MRTLLLAAITLLTALAAYADFTVRAVTGDVRLMKAGKETALKENTKVIATDRIVIGDKSSVKLLNNANSKIYDCSRAGEFTVARIMMLAKEGSSSLTGSLNRSLRFRADNSADNKAATVYEEGCFVTRALADYDPEGADKQVDASLLGLMLAKKIAGAESDTVPSTILTSSRPAADGLEVVVDNTLDYPLYVNVVKNCDGTATISELGQPVGCYIVLPGQSLMRRQKSGLAPECGHYVIMAPCYFDIDQVLTSASEMASKAETVSPDVTQIAIIEIASRNPSL